MDNAATETRSPGAKELSELAEQLTQLLRLRTFPIGMKLFEDAETMAAVPGRFIGTMSESSSNVWMMDLPK